MNGGGKNKQLKAIKRLTQSRKSITWQVSTTDRPKKLVRKSALSFQIHIVP